jgi:hypothetical protein
MLPPRNGRPPTLQSGDRTEFVASWRSCPVCRAAHGRSPPKADVRRPRPLTQTERKDRAHLQRGKSTAHSARLPVMAASFWHSRSARRVISVRSFSSRSPLRCAAGGEMVGASPARDYSCAVTISGHRRRLSLFRVVPLLTIIRLELFSTAWG